MSKCCEKSIQEAAYYLWQNSGCPVGQDEYFWALANEQSAKSSSCSSKSSCSTTSKSCSATKTAPAKKAPAKKTSAK